MGLNVEFLSKCKYLWNYEKKILNWLKMKTFYDRLNLKFKNVIATKKVTINFFFCQRFLTLTN